jgi:hypothetical protein
MVELRMEELKMANGTNLSAIPPFSVPPGSSASGSVSRRDQGEALAKCLRAGLGKSRSLRLTAIFLPVCWSKNARCFDDPPHPSLDLGRLFRFHRRIHQKPFFS